MVKLQLQRRNNILKTWSLFLSFFVIVIFLGWVFAQAFNSPGILWFAVGFSILMSFASFWFSHKLVLAMSRAKHLDKNQYPEIHEMVENLCRKTNLPMPKLYFVDEDAPNAFATGRSYKKSVVAVTRGLVQRLNHQEIEGVLAHELSHIKNRDMLVSTVAVVLVGFIALLSDIFLRSLIFGGFRRRDNQAGGLIFIVGIAAAILAPIGAMLMRLAISRKREFLADASGALITQKPNDLASALEKISSSHAPMRTASNTTSHLWISDPFLGVKSRNMMSGLHKLFMTHPPVEERIKALRSAQ